MVEPSVPPRYRLASFPLLMTVSVLTRLLVNTANQLFTPFLTIIAAGLGIDVIRLGQLHIAVIYGGWLATDYGLSAEQLGTVALVIGCADLCGSGLASIMADGLGKRRGVLLGWAIALVVSLSFSHHLHRAA